MKVFRLMEQNFEGPSKELFKTYNPIDFENYIVWSIYEGNITYDPGCSWPSKERQVDLFCTNFQEGQEHFDGIDSSHWIDIHELNPNKEREEYIKAKLDAHYREAQELGYEIFAIILQGSQNYGLDIYNDEYSSDVDTKCIVLPSLDDIILNKQPVSTTYERENKEHIDLKDIRLMFDTFKKQNVNFVEVLFSDYYIVPKKYEKYWNELKTFAERITHAHPAQTLRAMSGMSMEKKKALKHPYPTIKWKIDKWGYDGKQLHHIIRISDFINRYICNIPFKEAMQPTPSMKGMLLKAKLNEYSLEEAEELATKYDDLSKEMKDNYIEAMGDKVIDPEAYDKLGEIKAEVLKQYFTETLLENAK